MIAKILSKIGNSSAGQKFFSWASNPKNERLLNQTLPQLETIVATGCYMYATAKQKSIDKDQRDMLQIQNVASGAVGLTLATVMSKKISKFGESVIGYLDPKKFSTDDLARVRTGLRVGIPLATTALCMRLIIPSAVALFSGRVMDKVRDKRKEAIIDYKA